MPITINPTLTTNASGSFLVTVDGFIQGNALDDPAVRNYLSGGLLDAAETLPMWGGIPISELLVPSTTEQAIRATVKRATAAANVTGISVFNQDHAMLNTPQSPVPQASNGMLVNFYRLGSGARIPVAADPALAATIPGTIIAAPPLFYDTTNQWFTATAGANVPLPTGLRVVGYNFGNSMNVVYAPATQFTTWNRAGNCIVLLI
jgi:hypothetical protein